MAALIFAVCSNAYYGAPDWGGKGTEVARDAYYDGQYTSLDAWNVAEAMDLTAVPDTMKAEIIGDDWEAVDLNNVDMDAAAWTTGAGATVTITAIGAARTTGVWVEPGIGTEMYTLASDGTEDGTCIYFTDDYFYLDGIQVEDGSDREYRHGIYTDCDEINVFDCLTKYTGSGGANSAYRIIGATTDTVKVWNCIGFGGFADGARMGSNNNTVKFFNCIIYGCTNIGYRTGYIDGSAMNCISSNNTGTDFEASGWGANSDYNMSDDATAPGGNSKDSGTGSNVPGFVNAGAGNFTVTAAGDQIRVGNGATPKAIFTDDIIGTPRGPTDDYWEMGAFEYVPSPTVGEWVTDLNG